ncbi:hypothetical protein BS78_02G393400 [Paspalum vaginatum]|nr:hypothetical protein BS78_02G393400 [Paspalum vaginatum]
MDRSMADHQLPPGFRFHPTDEELILHYLRNRAASAPCPVPIIADVDIYKFDPWDLPAKAAYGDGGEYYFFSPRDRKYPNGIRPNRAAGSGYWKATGTDKPIVHDTDAATVVGVKKALVFYRGRPPRGSKTNWIMHEYRLSTADNSNAANAAAAGGYHPRPPSKFRNVSMRLDDWVLCRIYNKSGQASPMVPPLADYVVDHLDRDEPPFDDVFCGQLTTSTSTSSALVMPPHQQAVQELPMMRLPKIPSLSDLLDEYALAQMFDTAAPAADHHAPLPLAVHPSLNQLLAVDDAAAAAGAHCDDLVYSPAAAAVKRGRAMMTDDECAAGGLHPPPAKRLSVGSSCFDAPQQPAGTAASVLGLGGLSHHHNNHMLPQF